MPQTKEIHLSQTKEIHSTKDILVPENIVDQVIGQDEAIELIKKAAKQRRHVLLVGEPGTGKSLIGQALADLLSEENLQDIIATPNEIDDNNPKIQVLKKGDARILVEREKIKSLSQGKKYNLIFLMLAALSIITPWYVRKYYGDILAAASLIGSMIFLGAVIIFINFNKKIKMCCKIPKILVDASEAKKAPFLDATGAHAGALLGDVLHDPLQSGGLGTPAHERLVPGMIHRANKGVLFIDEIANLRPESQQELLTAIQEKKYSITGQSERSSGAMVRSDPVPCDFILVAAGNLETVKHMHPALRSRIRGYGYETYMNNTMPDTQENHKKLMQFIAQEIKKDKKIPHFDITAINEIIQEAKIRAGTSGKLTLHLRELGGLIRAAGDLALEQNSEFVQKKHILQAKTLAKTLEHQIADKYIEDKKKYEVIVTKGELIGRVNGLAVIGSDSSFSGILMPIESEVTPGGKKAEIIATGKLGEIAKEAIKNVSAIILKHFGEDIKEKYDIFVQFIQTYEGVEGDSASIAVATAIISALKKIPVKQNLAMTGSLSVRGEVLAVGGINQKIQAAVNAGIKNIILPKTNEKDIVLDKSLLKNIKIIPVISIIDVLESALEWKNHRQILKKIKQKP